MDKLLFEQHPSPMLVYELETLKILKVNDAFVEKYHYSQQEIDHQGITIKQIHPDTDITKLMEAVDRLSSEGIHESGVHRHCSKEGEIFYVKITSQNYKYKQIDARIVVCTDITDQVEAEEKINRAYGELQHHISNSPLASVKLDPSFKVTKWSGQAEHISGYSEDEVLGTHIYALDFFETKEVEKIQQLVERLIAGNHLQNKFDTKITHKKGHQVYIRIHSSVHHDSNGNLQSVLMLIEDITEQKKSEIKYQRLFENANDSILLLKDHRFVDCNKQAEKLYKANRDEIIGKLPSYFSPDKQPDGSCSVEEAKKRTQTALEDGSNIFEWQHQDTEGNLIDVEVSLNKIELPDGEYVQAIVHDITKNKETQAELRKNEVLFRNLFLKSPAALVMGDKDNRIQMVNESFEKMFGYSLSEVKGKNIDNLIVPANQRENAPKMIDERYNQDEIHVESVRKTKSGALKDVIISGVPVYVDGKPVAGIGMYIDITGRKTTERELKKSLQEKQVLLEEVHHRVKNNLAIVSGLLQMQTMHVDDERLTKYIQNSQLRIQSMAIVHEMLYQSNTLSQIEFKDYVNKLSDLISETFSPEDKDITISVKADALKLNVNQAIPCALIISELITNAFEYAFEGRDGGNVMITINKNGSHVTLEVRDDGIGLPENFEEMRQASLGITLVENLCLQLETEVNIESGEVGTQFLVEFEQTEKPGSSSSNRI